MIWKNITNSTEADEFLILFGRFHDSCIREAHLYTDHFVKSDLSMSCSGNLDTSIKFVVQRQFKNPSCIEMLFSEVSRFNYVPSQSNYNSVIYEANIRLTGNEINWSLDCSPKPMEFDPNEDIWVTARKLKWRSRDEYLGEKLHYGSNT